ncbi:vitamin K epoxide reductase complex subunit 1-like protein 1 [Stomoxys calcitrans]|uniref:vitamin-K-epoxide reductase (warfarin-sensitive) n=1 Tax=Stomoxys calcitrans TaxID=35570 RepID=A0A1I8NZX3_STOCA|nr:vitamin K epoxide reductase complex subunit 1-like protein 1 [Stomoxys calcitrans]
MNECKYLRFWCILGFIVSLYATYVEINLILNSQYKALCDLAPKISCTKAFASPYGKGFGLLNNIVSDSETSSSVWNPPNGIFGIVYYAVLYATANINHRSLRILQFICCILSNMMSIYLAYILYILDDICVVCLTIYLINFMCLWEMLRNEKSLWTRDFPFPKSKSSTKID